MPKDINVLPDAWASFTTAGTGLTSLAAGTGCSFAMITNANNRFSALLYIQTRLGAAAPVAGAALEVYLLRNTGVAGESDDNAGDAGANPFTLEQADVVFAFSVSATANKFYRKIVDLSPFGPLGTKWTIGFRNGSSQALSATAGDHVLKYMMYSRRITP